MTYEEVKQVGQHAYWENLADHYMLWFDPNDSSLWITARDRPYPHVGSYANWVSFEGEPPIDGWFHPRQPCDCEICVARRSE